MRVVFSALLILTAVLSSAETLIAKATISGITEKGFVLTIGTQSIAANFEAKTKYWRGFKVAKLSDFGSGDIIAVRLKSDSSPNVVREMADLSTWTWLERIRKETVEGTVERVDANTLTLNLDEGGEFVYRHSEKSKLSLAGAIVPLTNLRKGQRIYVKGRLLSNLDTWIVSATDAKPAALASKQSAPTQINSSGRLKGVVDLHQPQFSIVDMYVGERLVHVVYLPKTKVKMDGSKAEFSDIERGLWIEVLYRRDIYGRPIASLIELFHGRK
ncbi:MAG: hypothetical protein ACAH95_11055 [Fimbriimonas sp.]